MYLATIYLIHIVNISPHCVQRNLKSLGQGGGQFEERERGKAGKERGKKQVKSEKERENCCQNEGADANHVEIT